MVSLEVQSNLEIYISKLTAAGATVVMTEPKEMDYNEIWEMWSSFVGMQSNLDMSNAMHAIGDVFSKNTVKNIQIHRNLVPIGYTTDENARTAKPVHHKDGQLPHRVRCMALPSCCSSKLHSNITFTLECSVIFASTMTH